MTFAILAALHATDPAHHKLIGGLSHFDDGMYSLTVTELHQALPAVMSLLERRGRHLASLTTHHASLEDVFVSLTGRHIRDA